MEAIVDICRRLDGVALAIELAAARVKMFSPRQLRDRLDERFRILTGGSRDVLPRQQTMRALIDWSHNLLDARERLLLRRLGTFAGSFSLEAAGAVGADEALDELDVVDLLSQLVDKSLVLAEIVDGEIRYRLLESTKAYAREKCAGAGETAACAARHLHFFCRCVEAARAQYVRSADNVPFDRMLLLEFDEIRLALDAVCAESASAAARLCTAIGSRWQNLGLAHEGIARMSELVGWAHVLEPLRASALMCSLSIAYGTSGNVVAAGEYAERSLSLARACGDPDATVNALWARAQHMIMLGRPHESRALRAEAEPFLDRADRTQRVNFLVIDMETAGMSRDFPGAQRCFAELHRLLSPNGRPAAFATVVDVLFAGVELHNGRYAAAAERLQTVLSSSTLATGHGLYYEAQTLLAHAALGLGQLETARSAIGMVLSAQPDPRLTPARLIEAIGACAVIERHRGGVVRAAELLAFVEANRDRYDVHFAFREPFAAARAALEAGPDDGERSAAAARGSQLTIDEALALARASLVRDA